MNLQAKPSNELGLSFSTLSGAGINWNHSLNSNVNLEFSGFYFYYGEKPPKVFDTYLNFGGEFQYNFLNNRKNRFYAFVGSSYWDINRYNVIEIPSVNGSPSQKDIKINHFQFNYGFGLGDEFKIIDQFYLAVSLSYQFQNSDKSTLNSLIDRNPKGEKFNGIGFGCSFRYKFK